MHTLFHILWHGTLDALKVLPFLFLTYLAMELLEHKAGDRVQYFITKAGHAGPAVGGLLGLVPQCGFSSMAAGLFAGRVITPGTLLAVFLATSDEMLPILLGYGIGAPRILTVLALKLGIAMLFGFLADLLLKNRIRPLQVQELCHDEHCHCERGVWRSALHHTLHVFLFVWIVNLLLTAAFELIGQERLGLMLGTLPYLGTLLSALIGLIPNCAASVAIATLWAGGVISGGAMLAGLLTGAGTGLLVLFRTNRSTKQNLLFVTALLLIGLFMGLLLDLTGLSVLMHL